MPLHITVPPNQLASFVVGSCGPLGKQEYKFTLTLDTIPPQDVKVFLGSDGGAAVLQGATLGVYDLNLQVNTPNQPPFSPGGWQPGVNKVVAETVTGVEWQFTWGYPAGGNNNYVAVTITVANPNAPSPPGGLRVI